MLCEYTGITISTILAAFENLTFTNHFFCVCCSKWLLQKLIVDFWQLLCLISWLNQSALQGSSILIGRSSSPRICEDFVLDCSACFAIQGHRIRRVRAQGYHSELLVPHTFLSWLWIYRSLLQIHLLPLKCRILGQPSSTHAIERY